MKDSFATPQECIVYADAYMKSFCQSVAEKIRELLPQEDEARPRFRLEVSVTGRTIRVDPKLDPYREESP